MNKVVLVYKSNTGFTKRYAQWIQEELKCNIVDVEDADLSEIIKYDIIIFGGGMHANKINGIRFIKNNLELLKNKHLIIFATGATPASAVETVKEFKEENVPNGYNIPFFYFQSGMNYKDMKINDKMIMNCLKLVLSLKKNKNSVEQGTMDSIRNSYDYSERTCINPLIHCVRELTS